MAICYIIPHSCVFLKINKTDKIKQKLEVIMHSRSQISEKHLAYEQEKAHFVNRAVKAKQVERCVTFISLILVFVITSICKQIVFGIPLDTVHGCPTRDLMNRPSTFYIRLPTTTIKLIPHHIISYINTRGYTYYVNKQVFTGRSNIFTRVIEAYGPHRPSVTKKQH